MPSPEPIDVRCSACKLPWSSHQQGDDGKVPDSECVRLLLMEIERLKLHQPAITIPSHVPTPPIGWPSPFWYGPVAGGQAGTSAYPSPMELTD